MCLFGNLHVEGSGSGKEGVVNRFCVIFVEITSYVNIL